MPETGFKGSFLLVSIYYLLPVSNVSIGLLINLVKNFTTTPVKTAAIIVPSLVPTSLNPKNKKESKIAATTQLMSKQIFTFQMYLCYVSDIALTNTSPEFITTFAITESETPKPKIITPSTTITSRIA